MLYTQDKKQLVRTYTGTGNFGYSSVLSVRNNNLKQKDVTLAKRVSNASCVDGVVSNQAKQNPNSRLSKEMDKNKFKVFQNPNEAEHSKIKNQLTYFHPVSYWLSPVKKNIKVETIYRHFKNKSPELIKRIKSNSQDKIDQHFNCDPNNLRNNRLSTVLKTHEQSDEKVEELQKIILQQSLKIIELKKQLNASKKQQSLHTESLTQTSSENALLEADLSQENKKIDHLISFLKIKAELFKSPSVDSSNASKPSLQESSF